MCSKLIFRPPDHLLFSSAAGTSTTPTPVTATPTPVTTNPSTTTPSTTTPSTTTPSTTTPSSTTPTTPYSATPNGVLGGIGNGIGPSGAGINTDIPDAGLRLENSGLFSFFIILVFDALVGLKVQECDPDCGAVVGYGGHRC
ncbi:LOW QUALITY PROTEIN: hypothetical protein NC652_028718 [Populus alba x Populus x berolinensis]|nr:LOW QUALITY PROTEIN: hypothetical protein NC652_028718 [Populus alba x Populus x berolinensis]